MRIGRKQLGNERGVVLVTALMVMALLTVVGMAALATSDTELQISGNQRVTSQAFYLAEAGIQHAVGKFGSVKKGLANLKAADFDNKALGSGSYSVGVTPQVTSTEEIYHLRSTGTTTGGVEKTIEATYARLRAVSPEPDGAFGVYGKKPVLALPGNKKPIDGRDWDIPSDFNCSGAGCAGSPSGDATKSKPGLYVSDPTYVAPGQGVEGNVKIGNGVPDQDWKDLADGLIPSANNNPPSNNFGTRSKPTITYIDNTTSFSGSVDGAGILIIASSGNLKIGGSFHYEGIVIVLDGGGLDSFGGTADLFGTVLMIGDNINTEFKGNGMAKYSSKAIDNVQDLIKFNGNNKNPVRRVAWREKP